MHGTFDYISTEQVVTSCKIKLGYLDTNDFDDELKFYVNEGAMHQNNGHTYVGKKATINFDMGRARVPCGYKKFGALYFPGESVFYVDKKYYNGPDINGETVIDSRGTVSVERGYMDVGCSRTGTATLWYIGANTNDEGYFLVPPMAERGLVAYALGEFKQARQAIYKMEYKDHQRLYASQKNWLNGEIRVDEAQDDRLQLGAIWNARAIDKLDGYLGSIFANL